MACRQDDVKATVIISEANGHIYFKIYNRDVQFFLLKKLKPSHYFAFQCAKCFVRVKYDSLPNFVEPYLQVKKEEA